MNDKLKIKVITGSVRTGRFNDKAAAWVVSELGKNEQVEAELVDLIDYELPFFNEAISPSMKTEPYADKSVARFTQKIAEGDAFILVTPEYNHSTSGVLKNALDWVYQEWNNKPVAFVSYGSVGGARAVEHLRLIAVELQMAPIRNAVHIPGEQYFPVLFGQAPAEPMFAGLQKPAEGMISQLVWWALTLRFGRERK